MDFLFFPTVVLPNSHPLFTKGFSFPCHARTTMGLPMDADPELQFFNLVSSLILNFCIDHLFVFAGEITGSLLVLGQYFSGLYNNQNPKGLVGKQVLYSQVSPWYLATFVTNTGAGRYVTWTRALTLCCVWRSPGFTWGLF